ncbi:MAG: DUF1640 domain-containing protein [Cenarchaeum sp. SB0669_bin_11]|nr:DUF1640 domain-containing protein [Cenarchaeum sp. SB0669_bin_11]
MPQVLFDTHAAARKLEKAGHTAQQAEAVVEVVSSATEFVTRMAQDLDRIKYQVDNHMATKSDLESLRADLVERTGSLRADMLQRTESLRADTVELNMSTKVSIEALRAQMVRMLWIQGLALATLIISLAGIMMSLTVTGSS